MKRLKKFILKTVNRIIKHTQISGSVDMLQRKLDRTIQLHHLITPDILPLTEKAIAIFEIEDIQKKYAGTDLSISKNDLMFLFWLHQTGSLEQALAGYFKSGIVQADIIRYILNARFNTQNKIQLLDFASGHGRVSRYFKTFLPEDQITIADIKDNAVLFQKKTFGYSGFTSLADPEEMHYPGKFDFIIVSSLFTHLNKELFTKWVIALSNLLNANGILSVSLHITASDDKEEFRYTEISEDDLFPETSESLSGKNIYGLTHLSKNAFQSILEKNIPFKYEVFDGQDWAGSQVLFSIKRIPS